MDQKKELLVLLRNPEVMRGSVQWMGRNIQYIAFTLYPAQKSLMNWCLEELARISPYVSAEAHFRQTFEIKCLFPDLDYSRLSWLDTSIDRVITIASIEQARAKLVKLLGSSNTVIPNSAS